MKPKKLIISNFMILSSVEVDFDQFSSAIVVARINGDAGKSNGGGKSTISHALNYVLFDFFHLSPLEKIFREGQEQVSVSLEMEIENQGLYKITRSRRRKSRQAEIKLEKFENLKWIDKSQKTNSETEQEIQKLLNFNYETIKNTNFFYQSDLSGLFSAKSAPARKLIFEDLFQLQIFSSLEKALTQEKIKDLEKEILRLEREILGFKSQSSLEETKDKISLLENEKIDLESKIEEQQRIIFLSQETIAEQKSLLLSDKEVKLENFKKKKNEYEFLKLKLQELETLILEKEKNSNFSVLQLEEKRKELKSFNVLFQQEKEKRFRKDEEIKFDLEKAQKNEVAGRNFVARLEADVKQKEKQNLPSNDSCPECEQEISVNYRQKQKLEKDQKLKEMKESLEGYRVKLSALTAKKINLEEEWQKSIVWHNQLQIWEEKLKNKQKEILSGEENEKQQNNFILHLKQEKLLKKEFFDSLKKENDELEKEIESLEIEKQKHVIVLLYQELEIKKQILQSYFTSLSTNNKSLAVLQSLQETQIKNQIEKQKLEEEIKNKKEELELSYILQTGLKNEIPRSIINENIIVLEQNVNLWLQKLKPEVQILVDKENFEIEFKLENKIRSYDQLSFGQKFIIFVAFKLGMQNLLKNKFGFQCSLLQFDEVDQSFDETTTQVYIKLIKELQNTYKILVIAHNDNLKNSFSHSIVLDSNGVDCATGKLISH